jgi:hypothetical protein
LFLRRGGTTGQQNSHGASGNTHVGQQRIFEGHGHSLKWVEQVIESNRQVQAPMWSSPHKLQAIVSLDTDLFEPP